MLFSAARRRGCIRRSRGWTVSWSVVELDAVLARKGERDLAASTKTRQVRTRTRPQSLAAGPYVMSDSRTSITARRASMRAGIAERTPIAATTQRHVKASQSADGVVARDP